jgi:hypothetical protein
MPVARPAERPYSAFVRQILIAAAIACGIVGTSRAQAIHVAVEARTQAPGEVVALTVRSDSPMSFARVRAFGRDWPAYRDSVTAWTALIGIDLDTPAGPHVVTIATDTGAQAARYTLNIHARAFPTRHLTVDDAFVNPPEAEMTRIARDAADLAALWSASSPTRLWTRPFVRPVPQAANSAFGSRSVLNGSPRNPHGGADFASPEGTPIKAPNGGRVVLARSLYYTGNTVVIDHGLGLFSLFAHLSETTVTIGEAVTAGQPIGRVGSTGRVTGPHLHWAVRANGARVDPLSLLAVLGKSDEARSEK